MLTFVYVQFEPAQQRPGMPAPVNELGHPVSYEPAKWSAILHRRVRHSELDNEMNTFMQDLRDRIKYAWPAGSDYPTSLNLMMELDDDRADFHYIRHHLLRIFIGSVDVGVATEPMIVDQPASARILLFERVAA